MFAEITDLGGITNVYGDCMTLSKRGTKSLSPDIAGRLIARLTVNWNRRNKHGLLKM